MTDNVDITSKIQILFRPVIMPFTTSIKVLFSNGKIILNCIRNYDYKLKIEMKELILFIKDNIVSHDKKYLENQAKKKLEFQNNLQYDDIFDEEITSSLFQSF